MKLFHFTDQPSTSLNTKKNFFIRPGFLILLTLSALALIFAAYSYPKIYLKTKNSFSTSGHLEEVPGGKINGSGDYLPFYGYSIVSQVSEDLSHLEKFIQGTKHLRKFVSPLPSSSYHVTYFAIFSQRKVPDKYRPNSGVVPSHDWLDSFKLLHSDMLEAQSKCNAMKDTKVTFTFIKESYFLGRRPGSGFVVHVKLSHETEVEQLRTECESIFKCKKARKFHVPLGYLYNPIQDQDMASIHSELDQLMSLMRGGYSLEPPNVVYFESVKYFQPITEYFKMKTNL